MTKEVSVRITNLNITRSTVEIEVEIFDFSELGKFILNILLCSFFVDVCD
jgi:hypothetical protein